MRKLLKQSMRTPDGTVLTSYSRHDFKQYADANGEVYMIDGGIDYERGSINHVPAECLNIYEDDPHEKVRGNVSWGTYGIKGDQPMRRVLVKDLTSGHIDNILLIPPLHPLYRTMFLNELKYRVGL